MYKLEKPDATDNMVKVVKRSTDNTFIPFDPANTDYAEFKKAVTEGAELEDADGNVVSPEAAQEFIRTLP